MTGAFSWNVGKLFSELKLVKDDLLFINAEANWEATESLHVHVAITFQKGLQTQNPTWPYILITGHTTPCETSSWPDCCNIKY